MKKIELKNLFLTNAPLIIISLFLGYSFWYIASYDQTVTLQINVPLCFAGTTDNYSLQAPEKIDVTLKGKRADIYALEKQSLAAHINTSKLLPGIHGIIITEQHLFLPKSVALVQYKPTNLTITISEIKNS
ncbi:MAG TPA: hypothetical protein VKR54_01820 [Candidatus Babeliales bacterium]|nr:hypothetical protein [Candidatus Babeliales bacterium]